MKTQSLVLLFAALAASFAAQAQSTVTRAEVRQELDQLAAVGYRPARNDIRYPDAIQAAEARLHGAQASAGVGYQAGARSEAGAGRTASPYLHH
ncbi:DUF4148 domain-containing protein [Burkholderia sp. Ac-20379]|uniref:DUF4148 domain-containing protein n=1 Tax=Burkholderia sp. Ac-20379 TaxID=2703900 RepID=UPI0030D89D70